MDVERVESQKERKRERERDRERLVYLSRGLKSRRIKKKEK